MKHSFCLDSSSISKASCLVCEKKIWRTQTLVISSTVDKESSTHACMYMQSPLNPAQQLSPNIKDQPPVWNQPVMAWFCGLLLRSLASGGFGSSFWLKKDLQHCRSQQQHKKCQTEIKSLVKRPELDARERAYLSPPSSQNWLGRGGGVVLKL